jgi:hypothetical protein
VQVLTNRLVVHEKYDLNIEQFAKREKKTATRVWRLEDSIWAPRVPWCDPRSFWDTPTCAREAFVLDWARACDHGLAKFILRNDDGHDGGEAADEVDETMEVLYGHHDLVYALFKYYSSLGASDDLYHMQFNGFAQFVSDFGLADAESPYCKIANWDQLFISVDSSLSYSGAAPTPLNEKYNRKKALNRQEWLHAIIKGAVMRYVQPGTMADVSSAVDYHIHHDIAPHADAHVFAPSNAFRKIIYTEQVDDVLRAHEGSLRVLFAAVCDLQEYTMDHGGLTNRLFTYASWRTLLREFSLIDQNCTDKDVMLCFNWSKMQTVNEQDAISRVKMTHASFEDFLEMLCRLAVIKAFPTDAEVTASHCPDAASFLLKQAAVDPAEDEAFRKERCVPWGWLPTGEHAVPVHRKVDMLVTWFIVIAQGGLERKPSSELVLTGRQARRMLKPRRTSVTVVDVPTPGPLNRRASAES